MNIATELSDIIRMLQRLEAGQASMVPRFDSLENGNAAIMDALSAQSRRLDKQEDLLKKILETLTLPPAAKVIFTITMAGHTTEGATKVKIKDSQEFDVNVTFQDAKGNPASVEGVPTWTVDNTTALTVTPAADGLSAVVSAVGPIGTGQVSVSADADLGEGTTTITGILDVEVIAGDATLITLNPGPARDQAGPTPPTP